MQIYQKNKIYIINIMDNMLKKIENQTTINNVTMNDEIKHNITSDKIFKKNKKGEILNLEDNPSDDYFTKKLLKLVFDNFDSYGTRVSLTSRTKSVVEYLENDTYEKKKIKAILSCGADG